MTFLLSDDVRARLLRQHFVFKVHFHPHFFYRHPAVTFLKVVPCLNPDGVALGHYRADTQGNNLNRFYDNPDAQHHPTVLAVKELLKGLHAIGRYDHRGAVQRRINVVTCCRLDCTIDLHTHASKRGVFCFGNSLPHYSEQVLDVATRDFGCVTRARSKTCCLRS